MSDGELISRLKEARTAAGLTQLELAEKIGVSRKTINTVENGVGWPLQANVPMNLTYSGELWARATGARSRGSSRRRHFPAKSTMRWWA